MTYTDVEVAWPSSRCERITNKDGLHVHIVTVKRKGKRFEGSKQECPICAEHRASVAGDKGGQA